MTMMENRGRKRKANVADAREPISKFSALQTARNDRRAGDMARVFLSFLPEDASMEHADSRELMKAFAIVKAELQHRSNSMLISCSKEGSCQSLDIVGVSVPEDVMLHVLSFLPKAEISTGVSLVCRSWLSLSQSPKLWHRLDGENGLLCRSRTVTNMDKFLRLLSRPQFANLLFLSPPDKVKMRKKALDTIARYCPLLRNVDLGYSFWSSMHIDDDALCRLPELFPHLTGVKFDTAKLTSRGICKFIEIMGRNLKDIRINQCYDSSPAYIIDDQIIEVIASNNPNIEHFQVDQSHSCCSTIKSKGITIQGLKTLVHKCPKLKSLVLIATNNVEIKAFLDFLVSTYNSSHRVLDKLSLAIATESNVEYEAWQTPSKMAKLQEIVKELEILPRHVYICRISRARNSQKIWY